MVVVGRIIGKAAGTKREKNHYDKRDLGYCCKNKKTNTFKEIVFEGSWGQLEGHHNV